MVLTKDKLFERIFQSEIRNMSVECERIGGINLSQGVCDVPIPTEAASGAKNAIDVGANSYSRYDGFKDLRESISRKLWTYNKIHADPEHNIVVTAGATGALYSACVALLNPGDEVILFQPFYRYHVSTILAVGAIPAIASLQPPDWKLDLSEMERVVSPKTRGILICSPGNPTGKIFTESEIRQIAEFAIKHDLIIFTDEIYEYFVYDDRHHISPGSFADIWDRTVTISGYSKVFSITGWRIGYAACNETWTRLIGHASDLIYVCAPSPLQLGVAHAIHSLDDNYYTTLAIQYSAKRTTICNLLTNIGLTPHIPEGAYYILADVSRLPGRTSKEKAIHILNKVGVATVPGCEFFSTDGGDNLIRICFAKSEEEISEACRRLSRL